MFKTWLSKGNSLQGKMALLNPEIQGAGSQTICCFLLPQTVLTQLSPFFVATETAFKSQMSPLAWSVVDKFARWEKKPGIRQCFLQAAGPCAGRCQLQFQHDTPLQNTLLPKGHALCPEPQTQTPLVFIYYNEIKVLTWFRKTIPDAGLASAFAAAVSIKGLAGIP